MRYSKKRYVRKTGKRRLYRRKPRTTRKRTKRTVRGRKNYESVRYTYPYVSKAIATLSPTISLVDLKTVQYVITGSSNLASSYSLDYRLANLTLLHKYYRLAKIYLTIEPMFNNANANSSGYTMGQILLLPIHDLADQVNVGMTGLSIGQTDIGKWSTMNHAKWVKFRDGIHQKTTIVITPNVLDYVFIDPTAGVIGSSSQARTQFTRRYNSTRDYDGAIWGISQVKHYGFAILFCGWSVPNATIPLRFKMTRTEKWAFKGYDANALVDGAPGLLKEMPQEVTVSSDNAEFKFMDIQNKQQWYVRNGVESPKEEMKI